MSSGTLAINTFQNMVDLATAVEQASIAPVDMASFQAGLEMAGIQDPPLIEAIEHFFRGQFAEEGQVSQTDLTTARTALATLLRGESRRTYLVQYKVSSEGGMGPAEVRFATREAVQQRLLQILRPHIDQMAQSVRHGKTDAQLEAERQAAITAEKKTLQGALQ